MVEIQTILQKFNEKMILMLGLNENQQDVGHINIL